MDLRGRIHGDEVLGLDLLDFGVFAENVEIIIFRAYF